jgi:hypothetical protein
VKQRSALSPRLGQDLTELGKQISCVLSFFLSLFSTFVYVYNCHPHCFGCLINLLQTSSILLVCFLSNLQQLAPIVGHKDQTIIKYHGFEVGF